MVIHKIQISGFGKLCNKELELQKGIHVIYGENEAGKSTLKQFIVSMLYDIERLRGKGAKTDEYHRFEPKFGGKYGGTIEFEMEDTYYHLHREFQKDKQNMVLYDLTKGVQISTQKGIDDYFSLINRELYLNTLCVQGNQIPVGVALKEELNRYCQQIVASGTTEFDVESAIKYLNSQKQNRYMKEKEREFVDLKLKLEQCKSENRKQQLLTEETQIEKKIQGYKDDLKKNEMREKSFCETKHHASKKNKITRVDRYIITICVISLLSYFISFGRSNLLDIARIFVILIGSFSIILKKVFEKNLPDTRSMIQLEEILLCQKEREELLSQIAYYEKELLQNRMAQKYEKEKERHRQEIEDRYEIVKKEIQKADRQNKAIELAIVTLRNVSTSIYNQFSSSFQEELSHMMRIITNDSCQRVFLDEKLGIQVKENGTIFGMEHLSLGTLEQIYFAIRIVAGKLLSKKEMLPLLLDDVFSNFDDRRVGKILQILKQEHYPQVFIFTCNKRILNILKQEKIEYFYHEL